jgi:hypothetical protein
VFEGSKLYSRHDAAKFLTMPPARIGSCGCRPRWTFCSWHGVADGPCMWLQLADPGGPATFCPFPEVLAGLTLCSGRNAAVLSAFYVCSLWNCILTSMKVFAVSP